MRSQNSRYGMPLRHRGRLPRGPVALRCKLVRANKVNTTDFKKPFVLNSSNIKRFIAANDEFVGKFVFGSNRYRLIFASTLEGGRVEHKSMAKEVFGNSRKDGKIGAHIVYDKEPERGFIRLILLGNSTHFGKPTEKQMQKVLEYIKMLLNKTGIQDIKVKERSGRIIISAKYSSGPT